MIIRKINYNIIYQAEHPHHRIVILCSRKSLEMRTPYAILLIYKTGSVSEKLRAVLQADYSESQKLEYAVSLQMNCI